MQARVPHRVSKVMEKVRSPSARPYRIPVGIALTVGGVVGFLPSGDLDDPTRARGTGAGRAGDPSTFGARGRLDQPEVKEVTIEKMKAFLLGWVARPKEYMARNLF